MSLRTRPTGPFGSLRVLLLGWLAIVWFGSGGAPAQTTDHPGAAATPVQHFATRGHAHNDYAHERPLLEALERGFASVEADIFLRDGQLLVGHTQLELRPERTLEGMYLRPLADWAKQHSGSIHRPQQPLILLIDIKTEGVSTWMALHAVLKNYRELLSETVDGKLQPRAVSVIISGNRAIKEILAARPQLAGVDGRLSDLDSGLRADELPLISDAWPKHFKWRGDGPFTPEEKQKLKDIVARAHAAGRLVRFWATPESESLWSELKHAGVDLIGTDELQRLETFLGREARRPASSDQD